MGCLFSKKYITVDTKSDIGTYVDINEIHIEYTNPIRSNRESINSLQRLTI